MKYLILGLFLSLTVNAALNDVDKQEVWSKNIIKNGGFENGKAGWTASGGTFTTVTSGTNLLTGKVSATWDSNGAAQTLTYAATIPKGLYGKNGVAACKIQTPSGTATHTLAVSGAAGELVSSAVASSTTPSYEYRNFIFPDSGSVTITAASVAADEPLIAIDDCFIGDASEINLTNVSQAQFIGSAYIPVTAACIPTRNNTAMGAFGADADCPGPTVELNPGPGTIQTTDANGPSFTVNNLPPGTYQVRIHTSAIMTAASGSTGFAIFDGTNTYGEQGGGPHTTATRGQVIVVANFTYSSAGDRTFVLHARASAGTVNLDMDAVRTYFTITRFPNSTEQAYRPDASAMSWSGYHSSDCSWARTNTAYGDPTADATCTFTQVTNSNFGTVASYVSTNNMPGITFTPPRAGRYFVCANAVVQSSSSSGKIALLDGSTEIAYSGAVSSTVGDPATVCGIVVASSVASKTVKIQSASTAGSTTIGGVTTLTAAISWSIFAIDQQLPAPLLVNSVVNPRSGVTNICSALVTHNGTPTITRSDGDCLASVASDNGAGNTTFNFASGTFSSAPNCTCSSYDAGASFDCSIDPTTALSSTQVRVETYSSTTAADKDFFLICVGPK